MKKRLSACVCVWGGVNFQAGVPSTWSSERKTHWWQSLSTFRMSYQSTVHPNIMLLLLAAAFALLLLLAADQQSHSFTALRHKPGHSPPKEHGP